MPEHTYRVRRCEACARRRRVYWVGSRHFPPRIFRVYRCSQGHQWEEEMGTLDRINEVTKDLMLPAILDVFTQDNPIYTSLRRR